MKFGLASPTGTCIDSRNGSDCEGLHRNIGLVIQFLELREGTMTQITGVGPRIHF